MWPRYGPMRLRRRAGRNRYCISGEHYKKNAQLPLKKYSCHYLLHRTYICILNIFCYRIALEMGTSTSVAVPNAASNRYLDKFAVYVQFCYKHVYFNIYVIYYNFVFVTRQNINRGRAGVGHKIASISRIYYLHNFIYFHRLVNYWVTFI